MRSIAPRSIGPWLAVLTLTAAGAAAAAGYGLTAPKRYRATAQLLVSPVSVDDPTFTGLDVLRDSGGRRTAAESAATLVRSPQVADVVRAQLGLVRSRDSLLHALDAHVVDSSDVVAVTVEDTSAAGAAQLANAFADGLVKQRTTSFQSQLAATIRRDDQLLSAVPAAGRATGVGAELAKRLAVLRGFQGQPDPTLRHAAQASAPSSASWPDVPRLAAVGAGAGLAAGLLVALLSLLGRAGRRGRVEDAPYDRGVSDRLVERLEQRVAERIAALETERERLSAREAALAVRERDVSAKLDELRAAAEQAAPAAEPAVGPVADTAARPPDTAAAAELHARADELEARAEELEAQADELEERAAGLDARVAELTRREIALARRVADAAKREEEAQARTDELALRASELTARLTEAAELEAAERAARAAVPEPEPVPASTAGAPQPAAADGSNGGEASGRWNLMVLERLVNDRGDDFPDRRDEWASYLYFLREYAEPDGTVPASFDWLIQDTFAELVP